MKVSYVITSAVVLALCSCFRPALCEDESPLPIRTADFLTLSEIKLEPIIKTYFPHAEFCRKPNSLHGEFKAAKTVIMDGVTKTIPRTDGVVLEIDVKPGPYPKKHIMPLTTYETLYYSVLWTFCSETENKHVIIKLLCPHDMAVPIADDLKSDINAFVKSIESISPIAVKQMNLSDSPEGTAEESSGKVDGTDAPGAAAVVSSTVTGAVTEKPLPTSSPKPTKEYFESWFGNFYAELEKAKRTVQVTPYFSTSFKLTKLPPIEDDSAQDAAVLNQVRKVSALSGWAIEKVETRSDECADVVLNGKGYTKKPIHAIFRMVAENGNWRIDNGWTSAPREM
jgi:hypothetical protein